MRIEKRGNCRLFNGMTVSARLLRSILNEFFDKEVRAEISAAIERDGFAECEINANHGELPVLLKLANKKIALLENEIGRLTAQNLYLQLK